MATKPKVPEEVSAAARALSLRGAAKGGRRRMARLDQSERRALGAMGARARWDRVAREADAALGMDDSPRASDAA